MKQKRTLLKNITQNLGVPIRNMIKIRSQIEAIENSISIIYLIDGVPLLIEGDGILFPTLMFRESLVFLPKIIVDMGAVPHICNGADVLAPGLVDIEGSFNDGALIAIIDENNRKTIAIGQALFNSEVISHKKRGKILRNLHYVGDKIWSLAR